MKRILIAAVLFLTASVQAKAEQTITDLVNASNQIVTIVEDAKKAVAGIGYYAGVGGITPDGFTDSYKITEQQVLDYNNALQGVKDAVYYNAAQLFEEKHDEAMDNFSGAVDTFVVATQQLAEVAAVSEMATEATTVEQQLEVQQFVQSNDVELTQEKVTAYNNSLDDVETYAQSAAAFLQASKNTYITDSTDNEAQAYNNNSYAATVEYNAANDFLQVTWQSGHSHGYVGFFNSDFKTAEDIMGMGQSIYDGNTLHNGS